MPRRESSSTSTLSRPADSTNPHPLVEYRRRSTRPAHRPGLRQTIAAFVQEYGWRAYALPVLVVVTILSLMATGHSSERATGSRVAPGRGSAAVAPARPPTAAGSEQLKVDKPSPGTTAEAIPADALPAGAAYTITGAGTFRTLPGTGPVLGSGTLHRFTIDVENGVTGVDLNAFAAKVQQVLADQRSWIGQHSGVALQRVSSGGDFHITLTSSMTVRSLCGYEQAIETSCWSPDHGQRVVLNVARWARGDTAYIGDLDAYHTYMINHETGHALGHEHQYTCLPNGLAPVMMQQTITLRATNGQMCRSNPWPYPDSRRLS
jgi:Protein of unknown function (DUF3152)